MGAAMRFNSIRAFAVLFFLLFFIVAASAASRFAICTVTCTWDGSSTAMWSATSGGATGASVPGSGDTVTFDAATCVGGVTCATTVNTTVTVQSITFGACTAATTGCVIDFSANNNNVNISTSVSGTGTGTRTFNMGNGTWTITSTNATPWNFATTTNMTFAANLSSIVFAGAMATGRTFAGGGLTYNSISFGANSTLGAYTFTGANTIATLAVTAPNNIVFPATVTIAITNAYTFVGTSTNSINLMSSSLTSAATISIASGAASLSFGSVRAITFSGGATFTAINAFDVGLNTGITITGPSSGGSGRIIGG